MASTEVAAQVKDLVERGMDISREGAINKALEGKSTSGQDILLKTEAEVEKLIQKEGSEKKAREKNPEKFEKRDAQWKEKSGIVQLAQKKAQEALKIAKTHNFRQTMEAQGEKASTLFVDQQTEEFFEQSGLERTIESEYAVRKSIWDTLVSEYVHESDADHRGEANWLKTKENITIYQDGVPHTAKYIVETAVNDQRQNLDELTTYLRDLVPAAAVVAAVSGRNDSAPQEQTSRTKETEEKTSDNRSLAEVVTVIDEIKTSLSRGPLDSEEKKELKLALKRRNELINEAKEKKYIDDNTKRAITRLEQSALQEDDEAEILIAGASNIKRVDPIENAMAKIEAFSVAGDQKLSDSDQHLKGYMQVYTSLVRPRLEMARAEIRYNRTRSSEDRRERERCRKQFELDQFGAIKTPETRAAINLLAEAAVDWEEDAQMAREAKQLPVDQLSREEIAEETRLRLENARMAMGGLRYEIHRLEAGETDKLTFSKKFIQAHGLITEILRPPTMSQDGAYIIVAVDMAKLVHDYLEYSPGKRPAELSWEYIEHTIRITHGEGIHNLKGEPRANKLRELNNKLEEQKAAWQKFEDGVLPFVEAYYVLKKGYLADFGSNPQKGIPSQLAKMNINDIVAAWSQDGKAKRILGMLETADGRDVGYMTPEDKAFAQNYQTEFKKMRTTSQKEWGYLHRQNLAKMIAFTEEMTAHAGYDKGVAKMIYTLYTILGGIQGIKDAREMWMDYGELLTKDRNDAMMFHKLDKFKHGNDADPIEVRSRKVDRDGEIIIKGIIQNGPRKGEEVTRKIEPGDIIFDKDGVRRVLLGKEEIDYKREKIEGVTKVVEIGRHRVLTKQENEWAKECTKWSDGKTSAGFGLVSKMMAFGGVDGLFNGMLLFADPYGWWKYYLGDEMVFQNGMKKLKEIKENKFYSTNSKEREKEALKLISSLVTGDPPSISMTTAKHILDWLDIKGGLDEIAKLKPEESLVETFQRMRQDVGGF